MKEIIQKIVMIITEAIASFEKKEKIVKAIRVLLGLDPNEDVANHVGEDALADPMISSLKNYTDITHSDVKELEFILEYVKSIGDTPEPVQEVNTPTTTEQTEEVEETTTNDKPENPPTNKKKIYIGGLAKNTVSMNLHSMPRGFVPVDFIPGLDTKLLAVHKTENKVWVRKKKKMMKPVLYGGELGIFVDVLTKHGHSTRFVSFDELHNGSIKKPKVVPVTSELLDGFEVDPTRYTVSEDGIIFDTVRKTQLVINHDCMTVKFKHNKKQKTITAKVLVWRAFKPKSEWGKRIRCKNGDQTDIRLANLEPGFNAGARTFKGEITELPEGAQWLPVDIVPGMVLPEKKYFFLDGSVWNAKKGERLTPTHNRVQLRVTIKLTDGGDENTNEGVHLRNVNLISLVWYLQNPGEHEYVNPRRLYHINGDGTDFTIGNIGRIGDNEMEG